MIINIIIMDYHHVNENENHINHDRLYTIAII